jgi:hypothetical protein
MKMEMFFLNPSNDMYKYLRGSRANVTLHLSSDPNAIFLIRESKNVDFEAFLFASKCPRRLQTTLKSTDTFALPTYFFWGEKFKS